MILHPNPLTLLVLSVLTSRVCGQSVYANVVVQLPANIDENRQIHILNSIQELFNTTSQVLYTATGLYFNEIAFIIPSSWQRSLDLDYTYPASKADIVVTSGEASVFGKTPHAVQYSGCGKKGLNLVIPLEFLLLESPVPFVSKGYLLAREYIKLRYGVFDENGFEKDPLYPTFYKTPGVDEVKITSCTNIPVSYNTRNSDDKDCELMVDKSTNLPDSSSDCIAQPDPEANNNVTSSLLDLQSLPNVKYLCDDDNDEHPHQRSSPNKQNTFCKGRSLWNVLRKHSDFKNRKSDEKTFNAPNTVYLWTTEEKNRIIVAIDAHTSLDKFKNLIKNAISNLIYSLPPGSEFGVTSTMKDVTIEVLPISEDGDTRQLNNFILIVNNRIIFRRTEPCSQCEVEKAIQMLSSSEDQKSGTIILISPEKASDLSVDLKNKLRSSSIRLISIRFTNDVQSEDDSVFNIVDEISLGSLKTLYAVMESAIHPVALTKKIMLQTTELKTDVPYSFIIDQTIESFELWFSNVSGPELVINEDIQLSSKGQAIQPAIVPAQNFVVLQVKEVSSFTWTCTLKNVSPILMKITATFKDSDQLKINIWLEDTTGDASLNQKPVLLYASVFFANHPIIGAKVQADIKTPDGKIESLNLLDNGFGDPDITRKDGIYSRYFTRFTTSGRYYISFVVDDNNGEAKIAKPGENVPNSCCGSKTNVGETSSISSFYREMQLDFKARSGSPNGGYSPSTITDLRILNDGTDFYKFIFTAPGGEKDSGKAAKYKLLQSTTYNGILNEQDKSNIFTWDEDSISPKTYGETENFQIPINKNIKSDRSCFIALISENSNSATSDISNIVEIFIQSPESRSTQKPTEVTTPDEAKKRSLEPSTIGYIVGSVLAVTVVLAYIFFYLYSRRKRKRNSVSTAENTVTPVRAREVNEDNDGSVRASDWSLDRDPISPVTSVPATVLLQHHQQVKDAKRRHKKPPVFTLKDFKDGELMSVTEECSSESDNFPKNVPAIYINEAMDRNSEESCPEDESFRYMRKVTEV